MAMLYICSLSRIFTEQNFSQDSVSPVRCVTLVLKKVSELRSLVLVVIQCARYSLILAIISDAIYI